MDNLQDKISNNKKIVISLVIILLLISGLALAVFLIQHPQIFQSKAAVPQPSTRSQVIKNLTNELIQAKQDYQIAGRSSQGAANSKLNALVSVALRRKQEMLSAADTEPETVLNQAITSEQRKSFPVAAQPYLEEQKEIRGKLEVLHFDDFQNRKERTVYNLKTSGQVYTLNFTKGGNLKVETGSEVVANGVALDNHLVLPAQRPAKVSGAVSTLGLSVISYVPPDATGDQKTIVMLVNFDSSNVSSITIDSVKSLMFNSQSSVNTYYQDNSFNKVSFSGDVVGWYTITHPASGCDLDGIVNQADTKAIQAGVNLGSYLRKVYVIPDASMCGAAGVGTVGGNPSKAWIFYPSDVRVFEHELGHNIGIHHANFLDCGSAQISFYSSCTNNEYGDIYDVMGYLWGAGSNAFQFNAPHKATLGWIPDSNIQVVNKNGTYTVYPAETLSSNVQALKISKPDTGEYYYVSFRKPVGFDSGLPAPLTSGASIHVFGDNPGIQTKLIDAKPTNLSYDQEVQDSPLTDLRTFTDPLNQLTISQLSHNTLNSATVQINFGVKETGSVTGSWSNQNSIPKSLYGHSAVYVNGYFYILGGYGGVADGSGNVIGTYLANVYAAKVNSDNGIGAFAETVSLPQALSLSGVAAWNNYIFVTGGSQNAGLSSTVYSAKVNSDGSLSPWSSLTPLPNDLYLHQVVVSGDYLFVIGGASSSSYGASAKVLSAKINSGGTIGTWSETTPLPIGLWGHGVAIVNGQLVVVGGYGSDYQYQSTVYSAKINSDGTVGSWVVAGLLKKPLMGPAVVANSGNIIVTGGYTTGTYLPVAEVYKAPLGSDGTLGKWVLSDKPLPKPLYFHTATLVSGNLLVAGGVDDKRNYQSAVYSAKLQDTVTPTPTPNPNYVNVTPTCASPHDRFVEYHLDLAIQYKVWSQSQDSVWSSIRDNTSGQTVYLSAQSGGFRVIIDNSSWHDNIWSIRGSAAFKLIPDGRTYTARVFSAPYTTTEAPTQTALLAESTFSKVCNFPITQVFQINSGHTSVGLMIDKSATASAQPSGRVKLGVAGGGPSYTAENFLGDLNSVFTPVGAPTRPPGGGGGTTGANIISSISWFDPSRGNYTVHLYQQNDGSNFEIVPGQAYFLRSNTAGVTSLSGLSARVTTFNIPRSWSTISFTQLPTTVANAENLLQLMKSQGVDVREIDRWLNRAFVGHKIGSVDNNFTLTPGEGYFIRNYGSAAKTFNLGN